MIARNPYSLVILMKKIQKALEEILDIGYSLGINMVLMGEISMYLHEINIKPKIIEVIVDEDAMYLFEEQVKKLRFKVVESMGLRDEKEYYSLSATYMIYGVKVRVYANLAFKYDDIIEKFVVKKILPLCEYRNINKTEVPITTLELELLFSLLRKKQSYVERIANKLKEKGINMNHLNTILKELPTEKKNELISVFKKYDIKI